MKKLIAIAVVCACVSSSAFAGITGLYDTGSAGVGYADPYYTLVSVPSGSSTAVGLIKNSAWVDAPDGSLWIGPTSATTTDPVGWYTYQLTFTIDDVDPSKVTISGLWSVDNSGEIWLNGVYTGISKGTTSSDTHEYTTLESFLISSGLQSGENTLEFRVYNITGSGANPSALLVSDLAATTPAVPAPGAILLGSLGTGVIGWLRRRRTM